jgi:hypothetical protein
MDSKAGSTVPPRSAYANTLLGLAQDDRSEDPVLSKMSELTGTVDVATVRVLAGQLLASFER